VRVLAAGPAGGGDGTPLGPGELSGATVGAGEGTRLELVTVQPEGKRPMDAASWLNGVRPGTGDRLGA
jgi:methionyl-tRNA formyltransferase